MTHSALTCCYNNTRNNFKETKSHWFTDRNWSHTVCTSVRCCTPHGRPIKLSGTVRYIYFSNFKQHTQNIYINSYIGVRNIFRKLKSDHMYRWHCTKSSDCQVRVRGAPSNVYGVNVTKAVIGAYMWQWWLVQILWHLPCVFSSFCCLMNYYTVTFATCWYMGWVKILQLTFCVNLTVATVNFL